MPMRCTHNLENWPCQRIMHTEQVSHTNGEDQTRRLSPQRFMKPFRMHVRRPVVAQLATVFLAFRLCPSVTMILDGAALASAANHGIPGELRPFDFSPIHSNHLLFVLFQWRRASNFHQRSSSAAQSRSISSASSSSSSGPGGSSNTSSRSSGSTS